MNVVYGCDNNFAEIMGISMLSLFENNKDADEINVYVLEKAISFENKEKILCEASRFCRNVIFITSDDYIDSGMKQKRGSLSTFARLYLSELLPHTVNKVLYLDCDVLVLGSLSDLYNTDISVSYFAGVCDCVSPLHKKAIGLQKEENYYNAGVLLINLGLWRDCLAVEKFKDFSLRYNGNVPYADQGIINGVMSVKGIRLPLIYNAYTAIFDFDYNDLLTFRKPVSYYSQSEVKQAQEKPVIVHFTTSFLSLRPWIYRSEHSYVCEWLKYKADSMWADAPLRFDARSRMKKFLVGVYKALPDKMAVGIAGFLHSWVVPWIGRV